MDKVIIGFSSGSLKVISTLNRGNQYSNFDVLFSFLGIFRAFFLVASVNNEATIYPFILSIVHVNRVKLL